MPSTPADASPADLLARIERLERDLERHRARATMRATSTCPACGRGRVLHVSGIKERAGKGGYAVDMGLAHLAEGFFTSPVAVLPLEAYACMGCGLVEWYVTSFEKLVDGQKYAETLEVLEADDEDERSGRDPYR